MTIRPKNTPEDPVRDLNEALRLLSDDSHRVEAKLVFSLREDEPVRIRRDHFGGHYDRWFSADEWIIDKALAERIRLEGFVSSKPEWGCTNREYRLNERGTRERMRLAALEREKETT